MADVVEWDVIDGGMLGAVITCRECPCRAGTGCDGTGTLFRSYRLPGGHPIDTHRHAEALMTLMDDPPAEVPS